MTTLLVAALMSIPQADAAEPLFDVEPAFTDAARIRVAHLSPDADALDVYVDDRRISSELEFTQMDIDIRVLPGDHTLSLVDAATEEVVLEGDLAFPPNSASMIVAYDRLATLDAARIRPRRNVPLADDKTMFQVFHAADLMGTFDLIDETRDDDPSPLRAGLEIGEEVGFRHRNSEWRLGVDLDHDMVSEYTFDIPPTYEHRQVTVVPVADGSGDFFLQLYYDNGSVETIAAN